MAWLDPEDVIAWLRAQGMEPDDPELERVCADAELYVQRCRPDMYDDADPPVYVPDDEVMQGAIMYAARQVRRRNSPGGTETSPDGTLLFVARWDADIERHLRTGAFTVPGFG